MDLKVKNQNFAIHHPPAKNDAGFTLIEIILASAVLVILMSIMLFAIDPNRQLGKANNIKRKSDIVAVLNSISAYSAENKGTLPTVITTTLTEISTSGIDLCSLLVPKYISALPKDPSLNSNSVGPCPVPPATYNTGYTVSKDTDNRVTVSAPSAQNGEVISIQR